MTDFYMVTFEDPPYYDRTAFLLIVGFCLLPFISFTHFCWIPYLANDIEPCISRCCSNIKKNLKSSPKKNNYIDEQK